MKPRPLVSCLCPTFGRPWLLEEAIESFLRQDYPGDSEMIVLNDFVCQRLLYDSDSRVRVVNVEKRFGSIGEKRNALVQLCGGDIIVIWDDDDISLPHRITQAVEHIADGVSFFRPSRAWLMANDAAPRLTWREISWPQCAYSMEVYRRAGGYAPLSFGEDLGFSERVVAAGYGVDFTEVSPDRASFVYRMWSQNPHASYNLGYNQIEDELLSQGVPTGTICLRPQWRSNYEALCATKITGGGSAAQAGGVAASPGPCRPHPAMDGGARRRTESG
jgi:glycosyltransferase involved in cell wall biosynthesis